MPSTLVAGVTKLAQIPMSKTSSADELLTVKQVASRDRCSEKTVRRAIEKGLLDAMRIGPGNRLLRIHPAAHEAYRRHQRL